jgi:hypothetical protein
VLRIGAGTTVRAFISAPDAVLSMGRGAHVIGTFCVERTRSDKHIILEPAGYDHPVGGRGLPRMIDPRSGAA